MRGLSCGAKWLHPTAWVVAVLCLAVLAAAATVRSTVLNAGFFGRVLEEERVYERFYDEVLVAPQSAALTRDLLARLPVPESAATSNLKIALPPETLRAMANQQITEVIAYLEGDRRSPSAWRRRWPSWSPENGRKGCPHWPSPPMRRSGPPPCC